MDEAERELREFLEEGKPDKKAGRPPVPLPGTFEDAVKALKPRESEFVRHVLAGANYADAYRMTSSTAVTLRTSQVNGSRLATHDGVKHALKLGREAAGAQAISGLKYDMQAAHAELDRRIERADAANQHTAVSNLLQQKMKLHGLLIDRAQVEQASLVVHIEGVDTSRLINPEESQQ